MSSDSLKIKKTYKVKNQPSEARNNEDTSVGTEKDKYGRIRKSKP